MKGPFFYVAKTAVKSSISYVTKIGQLLRMPGKPASEASAESGHSKKTSKLPVRVKEEVIYDRNTTPHLSTFSERASISV